MMFHQACNTIFVSGDYYAAFIIKRKLSSREIYAHKTKVQNTKETNLGKIHIHFFNFVMLKNLTIYVLIVTLIFKSNTFIRRLAKEVL